MIVAVSVFRELCNLILRQMENISYHSLQKVFETAYLAIVKYFSKFSFSFQANFIATLVASVSKI